MTITVNGELREINPGDTLETLIAALGLADAVCAAERNNKLVPKSQRDATELKEGDIVEIVTLVGGG